MELWAAEDVIVRRPVSAQWNCSTSLLLRQSPLCRLIYTPSGLCATSILTAARGTMIKICQKEKEDVIYAHDVPLTAMQLEQVWCSVTVVCDCWS